MPPRIPFIPDDLADLHLNLTGDVAGVVADADFVPPPHDEVVRLLDDLARF